MVSICFMVLDFYPKKLPLTFSIWLQSEYSPNWRNFFTEKCLILSTFLLNQVKWVKKQAIWSDNDLISNGFRLITFLITNICQALDLNHCKFKMHAKEWMFWKEKVEFWLRKVKNITFILSGLVQWLHIDKIWFMVILIVRNA